MPLTFAVLASGSKGNAIVVSSAQTRILVDAGLSGLETCRRLRAHQHLIDLQAILVSHEHHDHVRGLGSVGRRFGVPVYLTPGTLARLPASAGRPERTELFQAAQPFAIGDLCVTAFSVPHDAGEPVGFVIEHDGIRLGICTDLGARTDRVEGCLEGCHALVLEANHDLDLLWSGPYPAFLKQRIAGRYGHLSNRQTCDLLRAVHHRRLQTVVLAHLSEVNNTPALLRRELTSLRAEASWAPVHFELALQATALPPIALTR